MGRCLGGSSVPSRVWVSMLVVVGFVVVPGLPAGTSEPGEHTFECGLDQAPSGPYLDHQLSRVFEYDCGTGVLVPRLETTDGSVCVGDARYGVCPLTTATSSDSYRSRLVIALVGEFGSVSGSVHDHVSAAVLHSCDASGPDCAPTFRGPAGQSLTGTGVGVTFMSVTYEGSIDCAGSPAAVSAHLQVGGRSGSLAVSHMGVAEIC